MVEFSARSTQKLPKKWLEAGWVENFSSVVKEDGSVMYTTDAIDRPDLCQWIRAHKYPQVTTKIFRVAMRRMCRDEVLPGYKKSELTPELRKLLAERIAFLGRRMWSCQWAELHAEADAQDAGGPSADRSSPAGAVDRSSPAVAADRSCPAGAVNLLGPADAVDRSSPVAAVDQGTLCFSPIRAPVTRLSSDASLTVVAHDSVQHSVVDTAATACPTPASEMLQLTTTNTLKIDTLHCPSVPSSNASFAGPAPQPEHGRPKRPRAESAGGQYGQAAFLGLERDTMLDDATLRDGLAEFGFGSLSGAGKRHAPAWQHDHAEQQYKVYVSHEISMFSSAHSLLPQHMSNAHLAEFHKVTALLRYQVMNDVPPMYYAALEHHFARCFSLPNTMAISIMNTDRFQTGRPDSFANQQAEELFSVGLTRNQHIIMGIECTKRVVDALMQAAQRNLPTAFVPGIWANTRDSHGNPCPRLVDMWLPRMMFNGTSFVVLIAPHGMALLERELEPFHAPCHPPFRISSS
jgi:hypothetical protein